jgi:hypothetical protein
MGFEDPPMHAKVVYERIRRNYLSSNLTRLGLDTGFEASYVLSAGDLSMMERVINGWVAHCPMNLIKKGDTDSNYVSATSEKDDDIDTEGSASPHSERDSVVSINSSHTKKRDMSGPSKNKMSSDEIGCDTVVMRLPRGCRPSGMKEGYSLFSSKIESDISGGR